MKETFYFTHDYDAFNDLKIQALISKYGMEGYGLYWKIIEMLHSATEHKLENKKYMLTAISNQTKLEFSFIEEFLLDCVNEYSLLSGNGTHYWSERVLRNFNKRAEISNKKKEAINKRWQKNNEILNTDEINMNENNINNSEIVIQNDTNLIQNDTNVIHNDTKEIKEKEIKEKEREKEKINKKEKFENFRKIYPGTKKSLETEYTNFLKKTRNSDEIVELLQPAIENQMKIREEKRENGQWVQEWKHLQTWINQRCWEEMEEVKTDVDVGDYNVISVEEEIKFVERQPEFLKQLYQN